MEILREDLEKNGKRREIGREKDRGGGKGGLGRGQ